MPKFDPETLTLPPLLLKEVAVTAVQKALESSKYFSQGNCGMLRKSSCSAPEEVQPLWQQHRKVPLLAFALASSHQNQLLPLGRWQTRNAASCLLKPCKTWGSKGGGGSPSLYSAEALQDVGQQRRERVPIPRLYPCGSWRGRSWVLRSPRPGSAGSIYLLFRGAGPRGCRGVTQGHCAACS